MKTNKKFEVDVDLETLRKEIPDDTIRDYDLQPRKYNFDMVDYEIMERKVHPSKSFFKNTAFGRTLSGRNKAGKNVRRVGLGLLGTGLGILTGQGLDLGTGVTFDIGDNLVEALRLIDHIAVVVGGIIVALTKSSDATELYLEKAEESDHKDEKIIGGKLLKKLKSKYGSTT